MKLNETSIRLHVNEADHSSIVEGIVENAGPDFLAVLYAVKLLRNFIALDDPQNICRLQRVCKDPCWQAMIDGAAISATTLDFTNCPARFAAKPKSCDQLRSWLQTRIVPGQISRVIFGPIDRQFHQSFCVVVIECCPNIQQLKFGIVGGEVPLQEEFAGMLRLVSLHIDILHYDYSRTRELSLSGDLSETLLPPNLLALTVRYHNIRECDGDGQITEALSLLERCPNLKYVHANAEDRSVDFNPFQNMRQLGILRLHCAFSLDFYYKSLSVRRLWCLEFRRSPADILTITPILFEVFKNSADHLQTLSLAFANTDDSIGKHF